MSVPAPAAEATPAAPSGENPSSSSPAAPSGQNPSAPAQPTAPAPAAAAPAPSQFTYKEDRSNWVPPHRLRETSTRAQQLERELYLERQRVAALSGVKAPEAPIPEEEREIRAQFERLYPGLGKLEKLADKLAKLENFDPDSVSAGQDRYLEVLGNQTLARLGERAAELYGGELSPMAKANIEMAFGRWIYENQELHARYEAQDPKLLDDFISEYQKAHVDPLRRKTTTPAVAQGSVIRRLPRAGAGSNIPGPGPRTLKPADTEEFHGAAFRAMNQQ